MSDSADGTSPYRQDGGGLPCPSCRAPMLGATGHQTCEANRCGEWWGKDVVARSIDWRAVEIAEPFLVFGAAAKELSCPECSQTMIVSLRAEIEFGHCNAHGLWLNRSERPVFDQVGGWSRMLLMARQR